MKWPLWVRIGVAPFRFSVMLVAVPVIMMMVLAGEEDKGFALINAITEYGNK